GMLRGNSMQWPRRHTQQPAILACGLALGLLAGALSLAGAAEGLPTAADRQNWSFQPIRQPALPPVRDVAWVRTPIDRFVLAKLEERGWQPAPPAEPQALLRRIYLDLVGLPPTPEEQEAFRADSSPQSLDHVIRDLLARPAYGERWAR